MKNIKSKESTNKLSGRIVLRRYDIENRTGEELSREG